MVLLVPRLVCQFTISGLHTTARETQRFNGITCPDCGLWGKVARRNGKRLLIVTDDMETVRMYRRTRKIDFSPGNPSPHAREMQENSPRRKLRKPIIRWISYIRENTYVIESHARIPTRMCRQQLETWKRNFHISHGKVFCLPLSPMGYYNYYNERFFPHFRERVYRLLIIT